MPLALHSIDRIVSREKKFMCVCDKETTRKEGPRKYVCVCESKRERV